MLSPFSALNKALNVKNELSVIVQICNLKFTIRYDSYYNLYAMHYNSSKNLLNKNELMIVLLTLNIMSINIGKKLIGCHFRLFFVAILTKSCMYCCLVE